MHTDLGDGRSCPATPSAMKEPSSPASSSPSRTPQRGHQRQPSRLALSASRAGSCTSQQAREGGCVLGSSGNLPDSFRLSPRGALYQPRTLTGAPLLDLKRDGSGTAPPPPAPTSAGNARASADGVRPSKGPARALKKGGMTRAASDGMLSSRQRYSNPSGTRPSAILGGEPTPGEVFLPPPFIALRAIEKYGTERVTFTVEQYSLDTAPQSLPFGVSDPESSAIKVSYKEPLQEGARVLPLLPCDTMSDTRSAAATLLPAADVAQEGSGRRRQGKGRAPGPAPQPAPRAARSDKPRPAALRSLGNLVAWIGHAAHATRRGARRPSSPGPESQA